MNPRSWNSCKNLSPRSALTSGLSSSEEGDISTREE